MSPEHSAVPHVFVTRADVTRLASDAWLCPTDMTLSVRSHWRESVDGLADAITRIDDPSFSAGEKHASRVREWPHRQPLPVFTAVPYTGFSAASELEEIITAGIAEAAAAVADRPRVTGRPLPLIALPLIGSAGGGGADQLGDIIDVVLQAAWRAARDHGVDVVLVVRSAAQLGLAQRLRRAELPRYWEGLSDDHIHLAETLAADAIAGRLVPFMGAGVSMSAGAPSWAQLIEGLADEAPIPPQLRESLWRRSAIDQAEIIMGRFEDTAAFNAAVIAQVDLPRYGLAPTLLAALPVEQAITLNYDQLFEKASDDAGTPCAVIPGPEHPEATRWLLKMHGSVDDPGSIVLTRSDYMGFDSQRGVLASLVKASLVTKRLLFVGFGLADDHFHQILHDVRSMAPTALASRATALTLVADELDEMAWEDRLTLVPMAPAGSDRREAARTLEILLDLVLAESTDADGYLLDTAFASQLTDEERAMADSLRFAQASLAMAQPDDSALVRLRQVIDRLGGGTPVLIDEGSEFAPERFADVTEAYLERARSLAETVWAAEILLSGQADEEAYIGWDDDEQRQLAVDVQVMREQLAAGLTRVAEALRDLGDPEQDRIPRH